MTYFNNDDLRKAAYISMAIKESTVGSKIGETNNRVDKIYSRLDILENKINKMNEKLDLILDTIINKNNGKRKL